VSERTARRTHRHIHVQAAAPEPDRRSDIPSSTRPSDLEHAKGQRHHSSRRSRTIRHLQVIMLVMAITLALVLMAWIHASASLSAVQRERFELQSRLRSQTSELDGLRDRAAKLSQEVDDLVHQRLPGLHALRLNATVVIDKGCVRTVGFTQAGVGSSIHYEYNLVLENKKDIPIEPKVRIILFDRTGLQTGAVQVSKSAATSETNVPFLQPGEIRAYTSNVPLDRKEPPAFFQIYVD
jgi:cell division protein FtsL